MLIELVGFWRGQASPLGHEGPFHVVTVAGMANLINRLDVFIDSIGSCVQAGLPVCATIVGDGKHRSQMEARCRSLGLETRVNVHGPVFVRGRGSEPDGPKRRPTTSNA
jgi:hypothetical protein